MKNSMNYNTDYDIIIVGGSYAGLSAGLALGRALRKVLIIDNGIPCNRPAPHSHNFLTQDGNTPNNITSIALQQLAKYTTVKFVKGLATQGIMIQRGFEVKVQTGDHYGAKKLIFATGIKDLIPDIEGFSDCWGKSIIHCPYCHGYEYKHAATGIFGNGDFGFEFSKLVANWTKDLTLFTNGKSTLNDEQTYLLNKKAIKIVETEVSKFRHTNGLLQSIIFKDGSSAPIKAMYARTPFVQKSDIPEKLGCEITEEGYIKVDHFQCTTVPGVFACGDNCSPLRSVANAVANGNIAGAIANKDFIEDEHKLN